MTLLAHWPLDDGTPTVSTARDAAAGGSGSHEGSYNHYFVLPGNLIPGGVGGQHLYIRNGGNYGTIDSILNPSDLRLTGTMTVMCWFHNDPTYVTAAQYIANCAGVDDTEAENDLWDFRVDTSGRVHLYWENGAGVDVQTTSGNDLWVVQGWTHIAAVRYEVVAGKWGTKFYANGQLHSTDDNTGAGYDPPTGGGNSLPFVGKKNTSYNTRRTHVDSIRVYDTAESQPNIEAVYDTEVLQFSFPIIYNSVAYPILNGSDGSIYRVVESGPGSLRGETGFFI